MDENTAPGSPVGPQQFDGVESTGYPPVPESSPSPALVRVVYNAPCGTDQPVEAAGRYWFDRAEYLLPPLVAADLLTLPGFVQIGAANE